MKLSNIIEGWKNYIFKKKDVEVVADERRSICHACPNRIKEFDVCGFCICPIEKKIRSLNESCPIGKWKGNTNDKNPE